MKKIALVLAGGSGKRFWPLSEKGKPKQLISVFSEKSLIEETIERLRKFFEESEIYIVTNRGLAEKLKNILKDFPPNQILAEPQAKNTAPSILWAVSLFEREDPETVFGIFPSDHYIVDEKRFVERLKLAFELAYDKGKLITFGITPTSPDTGYGYIETEKEPLKFKNNEKYYTVISFKEKPDYKTALQYVKAGNYFWNSGMFIWKGESFRENLKKYSPYFSEYYERMRIGEDIKVIFSEIKSESIDYALMEKSKEILLVEGDFRWSDVGSYKSLYELLEKDNKGNVLKGKGLFVESKNSFIHSLENPVVAVGLDNIFIIVNNGKIVVGNINSSQLVKEAYEFFEK